MKETSGLQSWRKVTPTPTMISDEALMLEFQGGSREAFEQLFARYRGPLFGYFRRRLNGDQRAEDLTQETFLAVIRAAAHYEARALVRTYLFAIAMNLLAAERRKRFRDYLRENPLRKLQLATHQRLRCGSARLWRNSTNRNARF
jgi:DNA-directed RNA polymerase specialized sigma24 family protein